MPLGKFLWNEEFSDIQHTCFSKVFTGALTDCSGSEICVKKLCLWTDSIAITSRSLVMHVTIAGCRLWQPNLHSQHQQAKLGQTGIPVAPIWKSKLKKVSIKRLLDKIRPLFYRIWYTYTFIYTYIILRIFMYRCAKSILKTKTLVSVANWFKPMFIKLSWRAVSYSIVIGQNKYICQSQNIDQITPLLESGQKLVT